MVHWCKHLAVRLWISLILGGVTALAVLPPIAGAFGPRWMAVPGLCLCILAYWLTGIVFASMGNRRIDRMMDEAKVWERAGMPREVRNVLAKALNILDSFLFSPPARKGPARRLLAQTARFQMAQSVTDLPSDEVIEAYLISFPHDREVAARWLDGILARENVPRQTHDIVARVKEAHEQDPSILQLAVRFFVRERCCDLTALQTYRQLIDTGTSMPGDLVHDLAELLLSQSRADRLALHVYMDSHKRGGGHPDLFQGIAACVSSIRPGPLTHRLLTEAESILSEIPASQRLQMTEAFLPTSTGFDSGRPAGGARKRKTRPGLPSSFGAFFQGLWNASKRLAQKIYSGLSGIPMLFQKIKHNALNTKTKKVVKWTFTGIAFSGVLFLVINTIQHLSTPSEGTQKTPESIVEPVTDPFTIQVAAYLKEADAKRYVEQLMEKELDAYWTRATGGGKTWYQVRVSHFSTKAEAKTYGEKLKTLGIIEDYYVANYQRPKK